MIFQTISNAFQDIATLGVLVMQVIAYFRQRKTHKLVEKIHDGEIR
jgi:hypothetical protein